MILRTGTVLLLSVLTGSVSVLVVICRPASNLSGENRNIHDKGSATRVERSSRGFEEMVMMRRKRAVCAAVGLLVSLQFPAGASKPSAPLPGRTGYPQVWQTM